MPFNALTPQFSIPCSLRLPPSYHALSLTHFCNFAAVKSSRCPATSPCSRDSRCPISPLRWVVKLAMEEEGFSRVSYLYQHFRFLRLHSLQRTLCFLTSPPLLLPLLPLLSHPLATLQLPGVAEFSTNEVMGHSADRLCSYFGVSRKEQASTQPFRYF